MDELINELKVALNNKSYLISINTALIIPDVCSALQSENGQTKGAKYINWFDKYVSHKYHNMLKGSDVWKLRCASLHQGTLNKDYDSFDKILFQLPVDGGLTHSNLVNNCLCLDIETFVNDIIESYSKWLIDMENNEYYTINVKESFKYNPDGLIPYINIPVYA